MHRFLCAASAALFLVGSFPLALGQTPDPVATTNQKVLTQAEARKKIENSGYSGVTTMKRDAKGNWTVTAMKGGKKTMVALSRAGKVSPVKVK
jgi:hypothetical protein